MLSSASEGAQHFCMARPTIYDVVYQGRKIAGAAQRRRKNGYLASRDDFIGAAPAGAFERRTAISKRCNQAMMAYSFAPLGVIGALMLCAPCARKFKNAWPRICARNYNHSPWHKTAIQPTRAENYPEWYLSVVKAADLAEHSAVRGCMVIKPWGYAHLGKHPARSRRHVQSHRPSERLFSALHPARPILKKRPSMSRDLPKNAPSSRTTAWIKIKRASSSPRANWKSLSSSAPPPR